LLSKNVKNKIYEAIILSFVLNGYGIWTVTLNIAHKLKVFQNGVLRRPFGPKRDEKHEMTGGWRKLYNKELHNL
jgi:hypothetical protein